MALINTEAQEIETLVSFSLPDPTTVNGRTHEITNTGTATITVTSTGATPFQEGGVNVVSITVVRGASKQFQSDGTRWVSKSKAGAFPFFAATGTTDASGNVTFNMTPAAFAAAPVCAVSYQGAAGINPVDYRIVTLSATSVTINCRISIGINIALLGLTLLGQSTPLAGAIIHLLATPAGANPVT